MPGEKIADTELSRILEISRTPIREALQLLCIQGFVEMKPGKETIVTEFNQEDLCDILPPLAAMQALAAEIAIDKLDDTAIDGLTAINAEFSNAIAVNVF